MTKRYAVVGSPISQSKSPNLHQAAFKFLGIDASYERFELPHGLAAFLEANPKLVGLSVTMPLKEEALAFADELDAVAIETHSCNTLVLRDGSWCGYNTDVMGLVQALKVVPAGRVLILGSGATSRSAFSASKSRGDSITTWARSPKFLNSSQSAEYDPRALENLVSFDLVVSTIPIQGLLELIATKNSFPKYFFSASYGQEPTIVENLPASTTLISGIEMLLWQAVAQQAIFAGAEIGEFLENQGLIGAMRAGLTMAVEE